MPAVLSFAGLLAVTLTWTPADATFLGNTYDAAGKLVVKGTKQNIEANLVLGKKSLEFEQTVGSSELSGTLRLTKRVGKNAKSVNAKVSGKLSGKRDAGTVTNGKFKIKENRNGIISLNTKLRGEVTKGRGKGSKFTIALKG
jgi:hypothetical protein